jgi:hypothetical protein
MSPSFKPPPARLTSLKVVGESDLYVKFLINLFRNLIVIFFNIRINGDDIVYNK